MARWVKGVSGNPSGRPRRDPLADPAVLEAIERLLHAPLTTQPKTHAELLALRVIRKATRGGSLKPIYDATERLQEYRQKKANRVTRPWDYGDTRDTGETGPEQANQPLFPGTAPTLQNASLGADTLREWGQRADQGSVHGTDALLGTDGVHGNGALTGEQPTVHGNSVLSEQDAMARLRIIQAKASPLPLPAVFGQPRKHDLDPRLDYLRPKGLHDVWNMAQEQEQEPYSVVRQEPEPRPASAPYRLGGGSLPAGVSWDTLATRWGNGSPEGGVGE